MNLADANRKDSAERQCTAEYLRLARRYQRLGYLSMALEEWGVARGYRLGAGTELHDTTYRWMEHRIGTIVRSAVYRDIARSS